MTTIDLEEAIIDRNSTALCNGASLILESVPCTEFQGKVISLYFDRLILATNRRQKSLHSFPIRGFLGMVFQSIKGRSGRSKLIEKPLSRHLERGFYITKGIAVSST